MASTIYIYIYICIYIYIYIYAGRGGASPETGDPGVPPIGVPLAGVSTTGGPTSFYYISLSLSIYIYIYVIVYICVYVCIIYIYIYIYNIMYIYIYIHNSLTYDIRVTWHSQGTFHFHDSENPGININVHMNHDNNDDKYHQQPLFEAPLLRDSTGKRSHVVLRESRLTPIPTAAESRGQPFSLWYNIL